MKKLISFFMFLAFAILPATAIEKGFIFSGGIDAALKPYVYEDVQFRFTNDNDFGIALGGFVFENIVPSKLEPIIYGGPELTIMFPHAYLSGGPLFFPGMSDVAFFARAGGYFGDWDWGSGKGNINIGLSFSPTIYLIDPEDTSDPENVLGAGIGSIFTTILNLFKIEVGVSWYLPV